MRYASLLIVALIAILTVCGSVRAQDELDPAKDALIVETLLRLDSFDLEAKPKTKAAVLRYLKANPGGEPFFQLVERFQIKDAGPQLLELAATKSGETAGVKAAELLLKFDAAGVSKIIAGADAPQAAGVITALGSVGGKNVNDLLMPLVGDEQRPLAVRASAATALGKSKPGVEFLLSLVKDKKLPADLNFTVGNILLASPDPAIREAAAKHISLPATAGAKPLPPLTELVKMPGDAARGKAVFNTTGTCNKCHTIHGQGKDVGPNLSEIGSKLSKEAFLVSILDPSAGISHNYETFIVATADGKVVTGLLVSQTEAEVVLKDANAIVHTFKKEELEEFKKLTTSLMPAELQKLMSPQELVDVVEYLQTLKKQ